MVRRLGGRLGIVSRTPEGEWTRVGEAPPEPPVAQSQGTRACIVIKLAVPAAATWESPRAEPFGPLVQDEAWPMPPEGTLDELIVLCRAGDVDTLLIRCDALAEGYPHFVRWARDLVDTLRIDDLAARLRSRSAGPA